MSNPIVSNEIITADSELAPRISGERVYHNALKLSYRGDRQVTEVKSLRNDVQPDHPSHLHNSIGYIFWEGANQVRPSALDSPLGHRFYLPYEYTPGPFLIQEAHVNQAPIFWQWRNHLAQIAHEFRATPLNFVHHLENPRMHRVHAETKHTRESLTREANVTEWTMMMIGIMWTMIHEWTQDDPTQEGWRASETILTPQMEQLCYQCSKLGWVYEMRRNHNHQEWAAALNQGHFFYPDEEWGVAPSIAQHGKIEKVAFMSNFVEALKFYESNQGATGFFDWTQELPVVDSIYHQTPLFPFDPALFDGPYSAQKTDLAARWWSDWNFAKADSSADPNDLDLYRRWAFLNLLAILRDVNYTEESIAKIESNFVPFEEFIIRTNAYSVAVTVDRDPWRHGFWYWNGNEVVRDEKELDLNEPATLPEAAARGRGDDRVSTYVVVVAEEEIDRASNSVAAFDTWNEQSTWVGRVNSTLDAV